MATANTKTIQEFLQLRLIVAALGERLPAPWWRSQFLTPTGLRYMERVFPRRPVAAALQSATIAARCVHDANLSAQSYHLFRLPVYLEDQLAETIRDTDLDASHLADNTERLTDALALIACGEDLPSGAGPKSLGRVAELLNPAITGRMAWLYATAAREDMRIYPYFEAVGDD